MNLKEIKKKELLRFLIGGGSATLVDFMLYRLLVWAGLGLSPSKAVSYITGAAVGFLINKFWTFERKTLSGTEVLRYILLYAGSACANTLVNKLVIEITGLYFLAYLFATGVSTVINFLGQKFFVFR